MAPPLLKDLIDRPSVRAIFDALAEVESSFDVAAAMEEVFDESFAGLELKPRIRRVAVVMGSGLAGSYREALDVLIEAAPQTRGAGFAAMALNDFVEEFGTGDFEASVSALAAFTRVMSAEFAVRHFLISDQDRMLAVMRDWAADPDPALRRLASEGSRPRLPWGIGVPALKRDPKLTLGILERLRNDPSPDVRRSVANHLNDITKDHSQFVVEILSAWQDGSAEVEEITRHALRTLVKRGDSRALALLGFGSAVDVAVDRLGVDPDPVEVGSSTRARWAVTNRSSEGALLAVDYAVEYHREGRNPARKVFKGAEFNLAGGDSVELKRKISLAPMSTRRIEPGPHAVEVQVNGVVRARVEFAVVQTRG